MADEGNIQHPKDSVKKKALDIGILRKPRNLLTGGAKKLL